MQEYAKLFEINDDIVIIANAEDYDIHDVNYELKAVGLPENSFFSSCSIGFIIGADIDI